jgi:hypothetical protein
MTRDAARSNDVHVRIGRLVVDRGAIADVSPRSLRERVADRIAQQLESVNAARDDEGARGTHLADVIASEVAARVSPRLTRGRSR